MSSKIAAWLLFVVVSVWLAYEIKGCQQDHRTLTHHQYNPQQIYLNSPNSVMIISKNGIVKQLSCNIPATIYNDIPEGEPLRIERILTKRNEWNGSECKQFDIHLRKVDDLQGGRLNKGKFGSDPVIPLN